MMERPFTDGPVYVSPPSRGCPIVVAAGRVPAARKADRELRFASGWGASPAEAILGCIFEICERFAAQVFSPETLRRARADAIDSVAVPPPEISLIGDEQFADRRRWNSAHPGLNAIPTRWRPAKPIDWVAATPKLSSDARWLPARLCYLGYPRDRNAGVPAADSNGVAAGTTVEDAAVRAFLELVERDAVAIWWYNRIVRPRLNPQNIGQPLVEGYAKWASRRDRSLLLHDLTHDLQIPVVAAVAHGNDGGEIALGFGAGASIQDAALHAVGELAQFEFNIELIEDHIATHGDIGLSPDARGLRTWYRTSRIIEHPHIREGKMIQCSSIKAPLTLAECTATCRKHGLQFLALDLGRATQGVEVVRVFVPGLRPMRPFFAGGRLYEVPVQMKWLAEPLIPSQLNPTPIMF